MIGIVGAGVVGAGVVGAGVVGAGVGVSVSLQWRFTPLDLNTKVQRGSFLHFFFGFPAQGNLKFLFTHCFLTTLQSYL